MTPKAPAPGRSLAERFPAVAATWDTAANGRGPETVAAQAAIVAHWRCAHGHTWTEQVCQRVRLDQWKGGDVAACRFCTGCWVELTFSCGHTALVTGDRAHPERLCPTCWKVERQRREAEWETRRDEGRARAAEVKSQCRVDARVQVDELWAERGYDRLPAFLHRRLRTELVSTLTFSLIGERAFGNSPHAKLVALLAELDRLAAGAIEASARGPVEIAGIRFWAPALANDGVVPAPPEPELLAALARTAEEALRLDAPSAHHTRLELMVARAYDDPAAEVPTADMTDALTYALKDFAHARGWNSWRELQIPLADARATGRLDLVIVRPDAPDVVIEIDSTNAERSVAKLELVRDRGALAVWLRWREGRAPTLPGVHVLDLTGVSAAA